jgi:hypothetical protein
MIALGFDDLDKAISDIIFPLSPGLQAFLRPWHLRHGF